MDDFFCSCTILSREKRFVSCPKHPPSLLFNGYKGLSPQQSSSWAVRLATHTHLVPKLKQSVATPPLPTYAFMTYTVTTNGEDKDPHKPCSTEDLWVSKGTQTKIFWGFFWMEFHPSDRMQYSARSGVSSLTLRMLT
jgi:hypothetical protein